ncbi:hypothetical protein [Streptomyces similanensis]|uniref:HNH endonuclease n=1 Tax=Streptomyces similanensis TaxID=1274988 RepID=A0ABP9KDT7_9ACTN
MRPLDSAAVNRLATLFRAGATDAAAARQLNIAKSTAGLWRRRLGIAPAPKQPSSLRSPLTVAEKWQQFVRPVEDGHMEWTGRRRPGPSAVLEFTHHGRVHSARRVAFTIRTGREPEGTVTTECERAGCVAPACVEDEPGRTRSRRHLAVVNGYETPLAECTRGHATAEHRRYDRDGRPYCAACHALTHTQKADAA